VLAGDLEIDLTRFGDSPGGVEDFHGNEASPLVIIQDETEG